MTPGSKPRRLPKVGSARYEDAAYPMHASTPSPTTNGSAGDVGPWGVAGGYGALYRRTLRFWWIKAGGITVGMTGFFALYFQVLHHPGYVVTEMPLTALDHWFAFSPLWLVPYVSLWVFGVLPPILLTEPRELWSYAAASAALSGSGLLIFYFWPTTLPSMEIDWDRHPSVQFLKAVDASGNACPSLHVGFAVFTAVWLEKLGRRFRVGGGVRWLLQGWGLAIIVSTLGIKQHVVLDVIAGMLLAGVVAVAQLGWPGGARKPVIVPDVVHG